MKYRLRTYQAMNVGPPPKYVNMDLNFQFGIKGQNSHLRVCREPPPISMPTVGVL
jgi:hypothetical protein